MVLENEEDEVEKEEDGEKEVIITGRNKWCSLCLGFTVYTSVTNSHLFFI